MSDAILVTGAGGFVGSAITRHLARRLRRGPILVAGEHEASRVVGVVRPGGARARLVEIEAEAAFTIREVDLQSTADVRRLLAELRPVALVHTALDRAAYHDDSDATRERLVAAPLRELVEGLALHGGFRFVHTGSAWVLPAGDALDETAEPAPASPYARAKQLEDGLLPGLAADAGVEWVNLRLFNLFGRHERPERLIPYIVRRLSVGEPADLSAAENVRDFTDVELVAECFAHALGAPRTAADQLYHVGTGRGTAIGDVAAWVAETLGSPELVRFGRRITPDLEMRVQVANVDRARSRLGWDPPDDLRDRIRAATRWWIPRFTKTAIPFIGTSE